MHFLSVQKFTLYKREAREGKWSCARAWFLTFAHIGYALRNFCTQKSAWPFNKPKTHTYSQTHNFRTAEPICMRFWPGEYLTNISEYQVSNGIRGEWRPRTSDARLSRPHCRGNQAPNWDSTERYVPNALIPAHLSHKMLKIREVAVTHHIYQNCQKAPNWLTGSREGWPP